MISNSNMKGNDKQMLDWKEQNGEWYCYKSDILVKGWVEDENGRWFHLNEDSGKMDTDWIEIDSRWYYLYTEKTEKEGNTHSKGEMATGWLKSPYSGKWYYLYPEKTEHDGNTHSKGEMATSTTLTINNKTYTFDKSGVMQESTLSGDALVSTKCIDFVKGYEEFYAHKYDDGTGTITQGYGCIGDEIADWGDTITEQQASDRLNSLINAKYAKPIKANLDTKGISLTQNQFDALVSFGFNIGYSTLFNSSLYKYIISGGKDAGTIKADFCMYNKALVKGVLTVMDGLTKRRIAESNMFNYGEYDSRH